MVSTSKQPITAEWLSEQLHTQFLSFTRNIGTTTPPWQADADGECWQFVVKTAEGDFDVVVRFRD